MKKINLPKIPLLHFDTMIFVFVLLLILSGCTLERYSAKRMVVKECRNLIMYTEKSIQSIDSGDFEPTSVYNDSIEMSLAKINILEKQIR